MKSFFERLKNRALAARDARTSTGRSVEQLAALVAERPGDWATENELADALARAGRVDDAVAQLCTTADRLAEEGWVAKAHGLYKKALRLRPQNEHAAFRVAELNTARISSKPGSWIAPGVPVDAAAGQVATSEPPAAAPSTEEMPAAHPSSDAESAAASTSSESVEPSEHAPAETEEAVADMPLAHADAPVENDQPAHAQKTLEEVLQEAETAAGYGAVNTAVKMLIDCARNHPDRLEPVAALIEIAARAGLDEALADAQARLCDLQCRAGDYESARATAQALVARFPDDSRHRARLEFILGEIGESAESIAEPSAVAGAAESVSESQDAAVPSADNGHEAETEDETETEIEIALEFTEEPAADPDALVDAEFQRALDALLAWDGSSAAAGVLAEARAGLERAANVPRHRVAAARQLAQLDSDAGDWMTALGWLECAAEGMLSSNQEEELAYEMAVVLERAGDHERARGVLSEIVAKVGPDYRDVSARLERLSSAVGAF